jgi:hypothetical protein
LRVPSLALLAPALAVSVAALHCGGSTSNESTPDGGVPGEAGIVADAGPTDDASTVRPNPDAVGATTSSKVDLLLVVDNSASMGDKAKLLSASVGTLLRRVVAAGDVHVGVISSSLGAFGGDVCPQTGAQNGLAHLSTVGPNGAAVPGAAPGFLAYGGGASTDVDGLVADAESLVRGVGESGCGLEAQLESAYRFLVQPDPWASVRVTTANQAEYVGVDAALLAQRKAFLRPDSLVVVVMLTDEDDSSPDPRSIGGQGWAFAANQFPGSTTFRADGKSTTAPRATSACANDPGSPDCTSCGFAATCNPSDAACQKIKNDPECQKNGGYYGPTEDQLNVRFHRMKQRYGIDPQFPISRYVDGFTKQRAPSRKGEHLSTPLGGQGEQIGAYLGDADCTNPLFAATLPSAPGDETCNLPQGPRGKDLVVFAVIGGVPESLVGANPKWNEILGANPALYDTTGQDPHMVQSTRPRPGLPAPSATPGDNGSDPVHGREWDTADNDLQYACTFALPAPRTCSATDTSCDCANAASNPPLCGAAAGQQLRAKAYPTIRQLRVASELGARGIAGSICPTDATLGYASTMSTLADRLAPRLVVK